MNRPSRVITTILASVLALPALHSFNNRRRPIREPDRESVEWKTREDALARAKVFAYAPGDIGAVDFTKSPHDDNPLKLDPKLVTCRYVPKATKATTPKFDCELSNGDVIKVKYNSLEIQSEVAATRLLAGLGFGADHMTVVERLRCFGCPGNPFKTRRAFELFFASFLLDRFLDPSESKDFHWVGVERRFPGRPFEIDEFTGWHVNELDRVDPARGGASREEIDALRLIALLLGHWDNKLDNQRFVCREDDTREASAAPCRDPLLLIHDLGATFGDRRVDLPSWRQMRIWADGPGCKGGDFVPHEITEGGRAFISARLRQLSPDQLTALFKAARFPDATTGAIPGADVSPWVGIFFEKVRQITDHPPCAPESVVQR
jgi:hypothetical protein